jgi:hypothetical protein
MNDSFAAWALKPVRIAAEEVHASLGPGLQYWQYADALEAKFPDGRHHMERNVLLPIIKGPGDFLKADFTFMFRHIMVRVTSTPEKLSRSLELAMLSRLYSTGLALAMVLNFGTPELDRVRVIHEENYLKWKAECAVRKAINWGSLLDASQDEPLDKEAAMAS